MRSSWPEKDGKTEFHIDPFPKRRRLGFNGGFPKFKALYCNLDTVISTEIRKP